MGDNGDTEKKLKINQKKIQFAGFIFIFIISLFSALTYFVSRYFILIVFPGCITGLLILFFMYRKQQRQYNDLYSDYNHLNIVYTHERREEKQKSAFEDKYHTLLKLIQSSQVMLQNINTQIHEYMTNKWTELENITGNQKDLIHSNENIIREIKDKSTTFFTENNIVKELITNIAEKVDSEIGFSRNTLDRLKNLFDIITQIIKASEILYKNSEFLVSIMQTIENISNKIHVLSINASVIAARSGETGKSFMVVAKEVRNLSDNVKKSLEEMKMNSDKLKTSIDAVTDNIQEIETETKTTYEDMENLLMRFEGLNLSINIIDKKVISNMDIIKNFESLIQANLKNNNEFIGLLDSIDIDGFQNALNLVEQANSQFNMLKKSYTND